jgi:hypothetical protein
MAGIYDLLPRNLIPEFEIDNAGKTLQVRLKDLKDGSFCCIETYETEDIITHDKLVELTQTYIKSLEEDNVI